MLFIDLFDIICFIYQIQHILIEKRNRVGQNGGPQSSVQNVRFTSREFESK